VLLTASLLVLSEPGPVGLFGRKLALATIATLGITPQISSDIAQVLSAAVAQSLGYPADPEIACSNRVDRPTIGGKLEKV